MTRCLPGVKGPKAATVYYGLDTGDYRASDIRSRGEMNVLHPLAEEEFEAASTAGGTMCNPLRPLPWDGFLT